jgi:hypothetical protein
MTLMNLTLATGTSVAFELPPPAPERDHALFVLGIRKSGSTLFNRLAIAMARRYAVPWVDIGGGFFQKDVKAGDWIGDPAVGTLLQRGYMYGGFRTAYAHFRESEVYRTGRKVLLVRDPRDALVSQYFSTLKTHSLPSAEGGAGGAAEQLLKQREAAQQQTVDDYVLLNARSFRRTLEGYLPLLDDPLLEIYRYEDVIQAKEPWIRRMLKALDLPMHKGFIERLVTENDVQPSSEDTSKFIRKVTPGDHTEKLRAPTIEALDLIFAPVAQRFGYRSIR